MSISPLQLAVVLAGVYILLTGITTVTSIVSVVFGVVIIVLALLAGNWATFRRP